MNAAVCGFQSRYGTEAPKDAAFHLSIKKAIAGFPMHHSRVVPADGAAVPMPDDPHIGNGLATERRTSAVRLAGAVAAAILILTASAAPLFAQQITQIIDSGGDGTNVLDGPAGIAVDSAGNAYVTGAASDNVFKVTPAGTATQIIDSSGDGTNALYSPAPVAVGNTDNVYVAGEGSDNVFEVTPDGTITEIIDSTGDGTHGLASPGAIAVDSADNVYVAGSESNNAFKIAPDGTITQVIDSNGDGTHGLGCPGAIAIDNEDNVYITGGGRGCGSVGVFKIARDGDCNDDGSVTIDELITGINIALGERSVADCPAFDRNNDDSVTIDELVRAVNRALKGTITQMIDSTDIVTDLLGKPRGIAVDSAHHVYVASYDDPYSVETCGNSVAFKIGPAGALTQIDLTSDGANRVECPHGVAVDSADNMYFTGAASDNVFKITPDGIITQIIDSSGDGTNGLDEPRGIAVDSTDSTYVAGYGSNNVFKIARPVDCAALEKAVDERWGDAPEVETRIEHFDSLWAYIGSKYAGFATLPSLDWDEVRGTYRPEFESAESYGRLFTLTAEMMHLVHDVHTVIWSKRVCDTPRLERPPLFARYDYPRWASSRIPWRASASGLFGVCGTPLDDDRLLVYHVDPDNPAGLEPGDLILGYDGVPWRELATALEACHIPTCGYYRAAAAADHRLLMSAVMFNAHLFERLDVQRYGSAEIESIPTDDLLAYESTLECSEQIAPDGVELPFTDIGATPDADLVSWGRLEGNIGYIYVFAWGAGGAALFDSAVAELMDTDGLVIDMRNHSGGGPVVGGGTALLFAEDVPSLLRPHIRPVGSAYEVLEPLPSVFDVSVVADPATFYDRPIAVLTGPKTQSGGDVSSFVYSKHPRARRFGRAASGDFGTPAQYTPVAGVADDFVGFWETLPSVTGIVHLDSEDQVMLRSEQTPETEVWFTQDDVAAGRDTVVEAALAWIAEENGG